MGKPLREVFLNLKTDGISNYTGSLSMYNNMLHSRSIMEEQRLQYLEQLLEQTESETISIESAHGLISAVICSPIELAADNWLPLIFGRSEGMPQFQSEQYTETLFDLLMEWYKEIKQSIVDDDYAAYMGVVEKQGRKMVDPQPWAQGFFVGIKLARDYWFSEKRKEVFDLLLPVLFLSYPEQYQSAIKDRTEEEIDAMKIDFVKEIPDLIPKLYRYWNENAGKAEN